MTNKAHTTLTIALAITVAVLLADKTIEPAQAQAQNCATTDDLNTAVQTIEQQLQNASNTIMASIQEGGSCEPIR